MSFFLQEMEKKIQLSKISLRKNYKNQLYKNIQ
jgi:hypothetical protein